MRTVTPVRLIAAIAVSLSGAVRAIDYVGIEDACPVVTPYPPAGAGWAEALNASMDAGFNGGVADQWHGWKDDTMSGDQVFYQGTDQKVDGCCSQKLSIPQPPGGYTSQHAGVYQQIYVVPGETYTATARIRVSFPPQAYSGEDLIAFIGLDPFGEPSADGSGTQWSTEVASQNTWITKSISVTAETPVMTVALRGTRKWAQHGDGALVWFDQITFSGPAPTDPPPGPEPDPVDPESLIPETIGGNLVTHPDFESAFNSNVASGWTAWSTAGNGRWKRSNRLGPIGGGNYAWCGVSGDLNDMKAMYAKTHLLLDHQEYADDLGTGVYEDAVIVGRLFIDPQMETYLSDPAYYGRVHANNCYSHQLNNPRIDCWQGFNEPGTHDDGGYWSKVIAFEKAFTQRCHELGIKACVLNLSTGSPGNIWQMLDAKELLEIADYLGHHTYGGPADELMVADQTQDDPCSFSLRQRRFWDMYNRRGWRFPPVISTESTTYGGWVGRFSPTQIANDLKLYGQYLNADPWMIGTCIFVTGGCQVWSNWEAVGTGICQDVGVFNRDNPVDSVDGLYAQMFGAGKPHPITLSEMQNPGGLFNGGIVQQISGLTAGREYLLACWMKYEFRGQQPDDLGFYLGVDRTGQTTDPNAATIDWGVNQVADKAPVHETYTHVWRTFGATDATASIWLRAHNPANDPAFMVYVDQVEVARITLATVAPDFDGDNDVDQSDYGHLQHCLSGAGTAQTDPACADALLDDDEDVDDADFSLFINCMTGPNIAPDPACDG